MNLNAAQAALRTCNQWRKSSYSQGENDCVEVNTEVPGIVGVRDSKAGHPGALLAISAADWHTALRMITG